MPECCFDRPPATPANGQSPVSDFDLLVHRLPLADAEASATFGFGTTPLQEPVVSLLSPHVRHCVWLC
jgi:hypothetical protein